MRLAHVHVAHVLGSVGDRPRHAGRQRVGERDAARRVGSVVRHGEVERHRAALRHRFRVRGLGQLEVGALVRIRDLDRGRVDLVLDDARSREVERGTAFGAFVGGRALPVDGEGDVVGAPGLGLGEVAVGVVRQPEVRAGVRAQVEAVRVDR